MQTLPDDVFISLGSNIKPEVHIPKAVQCLQQVGELLAVSHVYQSPAYGNAVQPDYLNAAVLIHTSKSAEEVRETLRMIESTLGRARGNDPNMARSIDLDLCLFGSMVRRTGAVLLPHPDVVKRAYMAIPLAELAPEFKHPEMGRSLAEIATGLRSCAKLALRPEVSILIDRVLQRKMTPG